MFEGKKLEIWHIEFVAVGGFFLFDGVKRWFPFGMFSGGYSMPILTPGGVISNKVIAGLNDLLFLCGDLGNVSMCQPKLIDVVNAVDCWVHMNRSDNG